MTWKNNVIQILSFNFDFSLDHIFSSIVLKVLFFVQASKFTLDLQKNNFKDKLYTNLKFHFDFVNSLDGTVVVISTIFVSSSFLHSF